MNTLRKRVTVPLAIVLVLAMTPALSGCFSNPLEQIIEGATGGDVDLGGTTVPDGFPTSEVPLLDGSIQFGGAITQDGATVYNITMNVPGSSPVDTIQGQLEGAGFTAQTEFTGDAAEGGTLIYTSDKWGVLVVVAKADSDWTVNYTVTSAEATN